MRPATLLSLAMLALVATACSRSAAPAEPTAADIQHAATIRPADPRLAGLYLRACHACHGQPGTGAPLAGDRAAWAPRWAKGLPALTKSAIDGYRGMPAGGQCFACTPEDYRALIRFMAGRDAPAGH